MKTVNFFVAAAVIAVGSLAPFDTFAAKHHDGKMAMPAVDASAAMADGEVRKIDKDTSKLTIKHGEIKSLDMPPMTMVFSVKDKAMLDQVKTGDKIKFKVSNENGKMTVTEIQPGK